MKFNFEAKIWRYNGPAAWYFVTLPVKYAKDLKLMGGARRGFGSIKVEASSNGYVWHTSVFPDRTSGSYLLPVNKIARAKIDIEDGDLVNIELVIILDS